MNGAITDPEVRTIIPPSRTSHMMIGKSQNFFRSLINDQMSINNSPMMPPVLIIYHPNMVKTGDNAYTPNL